MIDIQDISVTAFQFTNYLKVHPLDCVLDLNVIHGEDIRGTNCYCDDSAREQIRSRIRQCRLSRIRLLDSGNYHYLSGILMSEQVEDFDLLLLDNHTDAQLPVFGGILSCGGWVADALENNPSLKKIVLVGPNRNSCRDIDKKYQDRICCVTREELEEIRSKGAWESLSRFISNGLDRRIYLSIDKDILNENSAETTWSQGDLSLHDLESLLRELLSQWIASGQVLIGADLCGEAEDSQVHENRSLLNFRANLSLIRLLSRGHYEE